MGVPAEVWQPGLGPYLPARYGWGHGCTGGEDHHRPRDCKIPEDGRFKIGALHRSDSFCGAVKDVPNDADGGTPRPSPPHTHTHTLSLSFFQLPFADQRV